MSVVSATWMMLDFHSKVERKLSQLLELSGENKWVDS